MIRLAVLPCAHRVAVALAGSALGRRGRPRPTRDRRPAQCRLSGSTTCTTASATRRRRCAVPPRRFRARACCCAASASACALASEYVLFDRADAHGAARPRQPKTVYDDAVDWIRRHGLPAPAGGIGAGADRRRVSRESPLDHVAFVSPDLPRAVEAPRGRRRDSRPADGRRRVCSRARRGRDRDRSRHGCRRCVLVPDAPRHQIRRRPESVRCAAWRSSRMPAATPRRVPHGRRRDRGRARRRRGEAAARPCEIPGPASQCPDFATVHDRLLHLFIVDRTLRVLRARAPGAGRRGRLRDRPPAARRASTCSSPIFFR